MAVNTIVLAPETLVTVAFGALAAATNQGAAVTLLTTMADRRFLKIISELNVGMVITYTPPGGAIKDFDYVGAGAAGVVDLQGDLIALPSGTVIKTWAQAGVAPASGSIFAVCF
jgi:hypothetical protein